MRKARFQIGLISLVAAVIPLSLLAASPSFDVSLSHQDGSIHKEANFILQKAAKAGNFRGAAWVSRRGQVVLDTTYHIYQSKLAKRHHLFRVGSVTKAFTAFSILNLAEQGLLTLADPVGKYVPEYKYPHLTLFNILTHQAGIPDWGNIYNYRDLTLNEILRGYVKFRRRVPKLATPSDLLKEMNRYPLAFGQQKGVLYSNAGFALLGMVIERITGQKFSEYVRENFLIPFGMDHARFNWEEQPRRLRLKGHFHTGKMRILSPISIPAPIAYAAGGLHANIEDIAKFSDIVAERSHLSPWIWDQALSPQAPSPDSQAFYGEKGIGHRGFGFFLGKIDGVPVIVRSGLVPGFTTFMLWAPDLDLQIVLLQNMTHNNTELSVQRLGLGLFRAIR